MSIGCKIVKDFQRPAPELVTRFKDMPVANIDDNMGRIAAVDAAIEPIGYKGQLLGTAFTVRVPQGDNLMFHAAMDLAKPGDVIVIDAGGFTDRAIFGELMATYCKARGIKGIVCDGAIPGPGRSGGYGGLPRLRPVPPPPTAPIRTAPARSTSPW